MRITRQDDDVLVLEAGAREDHRVFRAIVIASCVALAMLAAYAIHPTAWWQSLHVLLKFIVVGAAGIAFLTFTDMLCGAWPNVECLAFDRGTRRVLCVQKANRQSQREELDFERIRDVVITRSKAMLGYRFQLQILLTDGRFLEIATFAPSRDRRCPPDLDAMASAICETLGRSHQPWQPPGPSAFAVIVRLLARLIFFGFLTLAGMALELEHLRKQEVRSWPHAIGVIDEARVETRRFEYQGRHLTYDEIGIAYRFTVAGVEHHGSRFRGNSNWLGASEVEDVREKYRAGEKCVVYYDPTDPEDCVLQFYRSQQHDESVPVLAVGFMIGGLVGVGFVVRDFVRLLARASAIPDQNQVA